MSRRNAKEKLRDAISRNDSLTIQDLLNMGWVTADDYQEMMKPVEAAVITNLNDPIAASRQPARTTQDELGRTPLMLAMYNSGTVYRVAQDLLTSGAGLEDREHEGQTALMYAARANIDRVIGLLIDWGANVDAQDHDGRTALMHAAQNHNLEALQRLIDRGARIDSQDRRRWTALTYAVHEPNDEIEEIVRCSLANGANRHITDNEGWTVIMHVMMYGRLDLLEIFHATF